MKTSNCLTLSTSPLSQPARTPRKTASLALRQRLSYGRTRRYNAGKELDPETGLYYYGARYLDPKTSRWMSGDPAMGEYIPSAPINDEARKRNGNLPGMGGVFNYVNLHVYHYAGNNPVKLVDPDGEDFYNFTQENITVKLETGNRYVVVGPSEMYKGRIDGAILGDNTVIKVSGTSRGPKINVSMETTNGQDGAFLIGHVSISVNNLGDDFKSARNEHSRRNDLLSGVYNSEADGTQGHEELQGWVTSSTEFENIDTRAQRENVRPMTEENYNYIRIANRQELVNRE